MSLISQLKDKVSLRKNPIAYWRSKGAKIGQGCDIYPSAFLGSEPYLVSIGDHVRLNSGVQLITHDGGVWVLRELHPELNDIDLIKPIRIGNNVHIGTDAVIFPGVTIGDNCIIGIRAIVTKSIPDNSIAAGIPARVIENIEDYCTKHKEDFLHTKNMAHEEKKQYLLERLK